MNKFLNLIAMVLTTTLAAAQNFIPTVSVYADCSKNGYTKVITYPTGSATVNTSSGRTTCEWVQLWENGPKWATFNVGATITDYAQLTTGADATSYYNYTDQAPYYNTANVGGLYAWNNPNLNGRKTTWDKNNVSTGISDVATTLWGSNWKTPTWQQLDTLCDQSGTYGKTTWRWCDGNTTQYVAGCTLKGYKVSGVGDYANYSIFLPAAGYFDCYGEVIWASYYGEYWSKEGDSSDAHNLYFYPLDRNISWHYSKFGQSVRAVLAQQTSAYVSNVTLILYSDGCSVPNVITCSAGQQLRVNAVDTYGYHFTRWSDGNTDNPRQVQATGDKIYRVQFDKNTYSITQNAIHGSVSGPASSRYLDTISLTANPNYGYQFKQWSDGNKDNPRSFVLTQDTTFEAIFDKDTFTITTNAYYPERGTTDGDTSALYLEYVPIAATPNYGYHFTRWSDGNTDNPRQVQVTGDKTYTAQFDKNPYSITKTAINGSVSGPSSSSYLDTISLTASPNYGYHFVQWSDGNKDNPRSFVLTQDTIFEALFAKNVYSIATTVNDPVRGVVKGDTVVKYMETVSISATPNYGYHFTQWSDGVKDNPRSFVITQDTTFEALFDKNSYTITLAKDEHIQSVSGAGTYSYLAEVTVYAEGVPYYRFDHWSDGNTDNPRTLIVTQDTSLTAFSSKIRSGQCGDDLTWQYSNGTLVISGTGAMYDYTQSTMPWILFKDSITSVVINNGCTSIGNYAFFGLSNKNFKTLELPNSIEKIGQYAFANCEYLKNLYLGTLLEKISANAFANDERLLFITCYATEPPLLDESAFVNYDIYLSVPCEALAEYKVAKGWKKFNKENLKCIGAEETTVTNDDVTVNPNENDAAFTWPTNTQAASYSLQITKDGVVFCTLTFNSLGQLTGLAFTPGRGTAMEATEQAAIQSGNGFTFTVTGLNSASAYAFNMEVKNSGDQTIKSYTGTFQTKGGVVTNLKDRLTDSPTDQFTKIIKDGQLYILRDGKTYNAQGTEVR